MDKTCKYYIKSNLVLGSLFNNEVKVSCLYEGAILNLTKDCINILSLAFKNKLINLKKSVTQQPTKKRPVSLLPVRSGAK